MSHSFLWHSNHTLFPQIKIYLDDTLDDLEIKINDFLVDLCTNFSVHRNLKFFISVIIDEITRPNDEGTRWLGSIMYQKKKKDLGL